MEDLADLDTFGELLRAFRKWNGLTQQQVATGLGVHRNAISRWEQGDFLPENKRMVLELIRLLKLNELEARQFLEASFTALAPSWGIPYPRNPFFTGCKEELKQLYHSLNGQQSAENTRSYALYGLGGIGKTQLAIEYAYRYALEYTAVFWVHAESMETIIASFLAIAELLQLRERQEADQQGIIVAVQRWLTTRNGWLLIWDNLEDGELLHRYLPSIRQGAVLITTRRLAQGTLAFGIKLTTMSQEDGIYFLLRRARLLEASGDETLLQAFCQRAPQEYTAAQELVTLLGGLPLALDQVGAYIEETACSLQDYLYLYQMRQGDLLARRGKMAIDHPFSVATTLSLSVQHVERASRAAADLLRLCAFLYPDAISEEIIVKGAPMLGECLGPVAGDLLQWNEVISTLSTYSLIHRHAQEKTLSLHRLVQVMMQESMEPASRELWCLRAIQALNAAFPEVEFANWQVCERYIPHAHACLLRTLQHELHIPEAGRLFHNAGSYLLERGRYAEAERFLRQALAIRELQQEHDPIAVADSLNRQAMLLRLQGSYEAAEDPFQQAQELYERHLDPDHAAITRNLSELASIYYEQGKYDLAEALYQRITTSKPWESLDPKTLDDIARLFQKQGKYEEAEPLFQRALKNWERQPGPPHPDMTFSLNNLATLYIEQGKYEQAEPLLQRSLSIREQTLGPEHPRTAIGLHNLAGLFRMRGKYEQAVSLSLRAVHISEQQFGTTHPNTAQCLTTLAAVAEEQGNYKQAEQVYHRSLAILEQSLGPDHTDTARCLTNLADVYRKQGKREQAERLYRRALCIFESAFGSHHPALAYPLNGLATLAQQCGQYQQAEDLYQRALTIRQERLGLWHPDVAETLYGLATLFHLQHQASEALPLYQRALAIREQALRGSHPETEETRNVLERLLQEIRQAESAVERATPEPEQGSPCACGCGRLIDGSRSRGQARRFFSQACRQRIYRHAQAQKRHATAEQDNRT